MPTGMPTLLDIAKANGSDEAVGLIEEVVPYVPEVNLGAARTIKGTNYKSLVRTELPTVNFRNANQGVTASKSGWENRLVECFILDPRWECDKAVADKHEDGAEAFIAMEAAGMTRAAFITLGKQFYYGRANDAKGHPGLINAVDANMVVDATGTTANTGSSVWAVTFGPQAVQWVYGAGGSLDVSDVIEQLVPDENGDRYMAYVQNLLAYPGLQVGSKHAVGRIKNLTADSGKGLTDDLLSDLLSRFPVGFKPDYFMMSRRSLKQLQQSRTATNPTGAPAPFPQEAFGIPIQVTDSILDTEAIA